MKRHADYKGNTPEELYIAETSKGFRMYASEGQALRWVAAALKENDQKAKLVKYKPAVEEADAIE